jgi:hypothetical protein
LGPNNFLSTLFSNTLSLCSPLTVIHQLSHAHYFVTHILRHFSRSKGHICGSLVHVTIRKSGCVHLAINQHLLLLIYHRVIPFTVAPEYVANIDSQTQICDKAGRQLGGNRLFKERRFV